MYNGVHVGDGVSQEMNNVLKKNIRIYKTALLYGPCEEKNTITRSADSSFRLTFLMNPTQDSGASEGKTERENTNQPSFAWQRMRKSVLNLSGAG